MKLAEYDYYYSQKQYELLISYCCYDNYVVIDGERVQYTEIRRHGNKPPTFKDVVFLGTALFITLDDNAPTYTYEEALRWCDKDVIMQSCITNLTNSPATTQEEQEGRWWLTQQSDGGY
jgi:hypothetical protein